MRLGMSISIHQHRHQHGHQRRHLQHMAWPPLVLAHSPAGWGSAIPLANYCHGNPSPQLGREYAWAPRNNVPAVRIHTAREAPLASKCNVPPGSCPQTLHVLGNICLHGSSGCAQSIYFRAAVGSCSFVDAIQPQRRHLKEPLRAYLLRASQPTVPGGGEASHPNVHAHPTLLHSNKPGPCLIYQMGNLLVQGPPIDPSSLLLRNHSFSWPAPPHHPQPAPKPLNHRL